MGVLYQGTRVWPVTVGEDPLCSAWDWGLPFHLDPRVPAFTEDTKEKRRENLEEYRRRAENRETIIEYD